MDKIELKNQTQDVLNCENCDHKMVNIDADQLAPGDLTTLKTAGVRISNPETEEAVCLNCEVQAKPTFREKLASWYDDNDDDDSSLFSSGGIFGGSSSFGGFGGFGGGSFSGGGASRSF